MHVPCSTKPCRASPPPKEVDHVSFTYMCFTRRALYYPCSARQISEWPYPLRWFPLPLEVLRSFLRQLLSQITPLFQMPCGGKPTHLAPFGILESHNAQQVVSPLPQHPLAFGISWIEVPKPPLKSLGYHSKVLLMSYLGLVVPDS